MARATERRSPRRSSTSNEALNPGVEHTSDELPSAIAYGNSIIEQIETYGVGLVGSPPENDAGYYAEITGYEQDNNGSGDDSSRSDDADDTQFNMD